MEERIFLIGLNTTIPKATEEEQVKLNNNSFKYRVNTEPEKLYEAEAYQGVEQWGFYKYRFKFK